MLADTVDQVVASHTDTSLASQVECIGVSTFRNFYWQDWVHGRHSCNGNARSAVESIPTDTITLEISFVVDRVGRTLSALPLDIKKSPKANTQIQIDIQYLVEFASRPADGILSIVVAGFYAVRAYSFYQVEVFQANAYSAY